MDAQIVQQSSALLVAMARLTEMFEPLPESAQGIAAARLAHVADYLQTVRDDFVQLTTVREQAVSDAETRVQRALDDGAARAADTEKLQVALRAEAEEAAASCQERASELDNREGNLKKREAELNNGVDALKLREANFASELDGRKADLEKREANLASELDGRRADLEKREANLASELDGRKADLEKREAELVEGLDSLQRREASLASELDGRKADLEKREAELVEGLDALQRREANLASELDDRKADLEEREAELVEGLNALQRREASLASELDDRKAGLEKREAELAKGLDALQRREANLSRAQDNLAAAQEDFAAAEENFATAEDDLATAEEDLARERAEVAEERVGIWMARNAVANDVSALEDLKKQFDESQQIAADRILTADAKLTSQMENLCARLAACSTETEAVRGLAGRLDEIGDRMTGLEQKAVSPADLKSVRVAIDAAVERVKESTGDGPGHAPRKRRRVGSPEPHESRWLQLVAAVASDMEAVTPEELEEDNPGLKMIYYELSVVSLRPSYKAHWDDFVESGAADVWHCLHSIFESGEGAVADDGCCRLHGQTCLRVLLRREDGVVRTLFTTPDAD